MRPYDVIVSPLVTEKAIDKLEKENKLSFEVNSKASKSEIAKAVSELYGV